MRLQLISAMLILVSALQASVVQAEGLSGEANQADKVHQAFESARKAQKKKPVDIEKKMADESNARESLSDKPLRDLNPADRRGTINTPVQSAQDAVSRTSPQP